MHFIHLIHLMPLKHHMYLMYAMLWWRERIHQDLYNSVNMHCFMIDLMYHRYCTCPCILRYSSIHHWFHWWMHHMNALIICGTTTMFNVACIDELTQLFDILCCYWMHWSWWPLNHVMQVHTSISRLRVTSYQLGQPYKLIRTWFSLFCSCFIGSIER